VLWHREDPAGGMSASTGCPGVTLIGSELEADDSVEPAPRAVPPPPPGPPWLGLVPSPLRLATWLRSRGKASVTARTITRVAVAASTGRSQTPGDRSVARMARGQVRGGRSLGARLE